MLLGQGARCVEIDCWDGARDVLAGNPGTEPVVTHGHTVCTKILFRDVIRQARRRGGREGNTAGVRGGGSGFGMTAGPAAEFGRLSRQVLSLGGAEGGGGGRGEGSTLGRGDKSI